MATTELNTDEVDAAHAIVDAAVKLLQNSLRSNGFTNAEVHACPGFFSITPYGVCDDRQRSHPKTYAQALAIVANLQAPVSWSPELIEATLYAGEAA